MFYLALLFTATILVAEVATITAALRRKLIRIR